MPNKTPITAELLARLAVYLTDAETRIEESESAARIILRELAASRCDITHVRSILLALADELVKPAANCDDTVQVTCGECGSVYKQGCIKGIIWPPTCCGGCGSSAIKID